MILTPVYCSSEPPPASGPVRSKMTPILIFFSWARAETTMPSIATAAISPTSTRAALRTGIKTSLETCALRFWFLLAPITWGGLMDVKPARCQKVEDHATVFAGMPKNASAIARVHESARAIAGHGETLNPLAVKLQPVDDLVDHL